MRNSYSGYQLMHTFSDNLQQGIIYSVQIAIYQAYFRRDETLFYQKPLSISALQIDYLNLGQFSKKYRLKQISIKVQSL